VIRAVCIVTLLVAGAAQAQTAPAHDHSQHAPAKAAPAAEHDHSQHAPANPAPAAEHDHSQHAPAKPEPAAAPDHSQHAPVGADPAAAPAPPAGRAADRYFDPAVMAQARRLLQAEHGGGVFSMVRAETLEYRRAGGHDGYSWDAEAWVGGDINRFVAKTRGEGGEDGLEGAELQALYARAVGPYFNLQAGVRTDLEPRPRRSYAVIGVEGLAPYWFEVEGHAFVSEKGEVSARFEADYDILITQRLILQPDVEIELSAQDVPELGLGAGLTEWEAGLRLRYEIRREFAPYVGISYTRKVGDTAGLARTAGQPAGSTAVVVGIRTWF
jgi:copper resistance protein B